MHPLNRWIAIGIRFVLWSGVVLTPFILWTAPSSTSPTLAQGNDQIVFASDRDGNLEIYTMNADGSNIQRLTYNEGQDIDPVWSPDRQQIAFVSARDGNYGVFVMRSSGGNPRRITPDDGNYYSSPAWSPDGNQIAFASDRTGNLDIHAIDLNGNNLRRLTNAPGDDDEPNWGPDGRIVFSSDRDGSFEIYTMNANGGNVTRLTFSDNVDNYSPTWSPDGNEIAFAAVSSGFSEIVIINANGSDERVLVGLNEYFAGSTTWSPSGNSLAFAIWKPNGKPVIQVVDYDGENTRFLTNDANKSNWPSWSTPRGNIISSGNGDVTSVGNSSNCPPANFSCPGAPATRLCVGMTARVTPGLPNNLRDDRWNKIGTIPAGGSFEVIGGPKCYQNYVWWQVNYRGQVGWTAEGEFGDYWLEQVETSSSSTGNSVVGNRTCDGIPQRFAVGDTVIVSQIGNGLRILIRIPGGAREAIAQAVTGDYLEITGGPQCAWLSSYGQNTWYYYIYSPADNVSGWVADGPDRERWLCPTNNFYCDR